MSNDLIAYTWVGHVLIPERLGPSSTEDGVLAIPDSLFQRVYNDYLEKALDDRIDCKLIGVLDSGARRLAVGANFVSAYRYYATSFNPSIDTGRVSRYMEAMQENYPKIKLTKAMSMIACSIEYQ